MGHWKFEDEKDDSQGPKEPESTESTDAEIEEATPAHRFELSTTPIEIVASETLD